MPALVAFGRKWHVGSDDFVIPGFIDIVIRLTWLIIAILVYWDTDFSSGNCQNAAGFVKIYVFGIFILLQLTILADALLVQNSKAGGCMDVAARKYVPVCIYFRLLLQLAETVLGILGSIWDSEDYFHCELGNDAEGVPSNPAAAAVSLIRGTMLSTWILTGLFVLVIAITFDPLGSKSLSNEVDTRYAPHNYEDDLPPETAKTKLWSTRCRAVGCACFDHPEEDAFREVGRVIGTSLQGSDLVLSDLTAGLMILCLRNTRQSRALIEVTTDGKNCADSNPITCQPSLMQDQKSSRPPIITEILSANNWQSSQMINHFLKYCLAACNWRLLPYMEERDENIKKEIWSNLVCCSFLQGRSHPNAEVVNGDNCCFCNTAVLRSLTQSDSEDIILASFESEYFEPQFFVAPDHTTKTVIISVCGTIAYKDYITDLVAWPVIIELPGLPKNSKVHHGFMQSALALKRKLENKGILEQALVKYSGYNIVTTGHSLGAAVATLLVLLLRQQYPNARCYAYSPPGACLTMEAADYCNDFVTSITYGDDLAGRMTLQSCEKIVNDITTALQTCTTPKYQILMQTCCIFSGNLAKSLDEDFSGENSMSESKLEKNHQTKSKFKCPRLYPPGKILHITENLEHTFRKFSKTIPQSQRWVHRWAERTEFEDIIVSTRMSLDHVPFRLIKSLAHFASVACDYNFNECTNL